MREPAAVSPFPETMGPYRLLRLLGHGGMSQVFLASRFGASGFEKRFALKTLPLEQLGDDALTRALIQEARLCAGLHHQNLVQVLDLGVEQGIYYLCMEFVDGLDLKEALQAGPLPVSLALWIAAQVALALAYVHQVTDDKGRPLGLVHRDVSPSNILLSWAGEVKLADFGIAKATLLADATWGRFRKGTVAYMSPEQVSGGALSLHSDLFGLGVVLCEMLTGHRPFDGDTPVDTMERIRAADAPDLEGCPQAIEPLLRQLLAPSPEERFSTARQLYEALEHHRLQHAPSHAFALVDALSRLRP